MSFFQKETFVAVDLETTGVNADIDKIIEFAGVIVENGKIVKQLEFVINPGVEISPQIQAITGITNEEVQGKPSFDEVKEEIQMFLNDYVVVGHNIAFDINFLEKNGVKTSQKTLDTYTLSSLFFHEEKSLALEVLSENLQIEHKYKHRALGDILATVELLKIIHQKIQELPETTLVKVQNFLQRFSTPLKTFFTDVNLKNKEQVELNLQTEEKPVANLAQAELEKNLQEVLESKENVVLESPQQYLTVLKRVEELKEPNTLAFYSPKLLNKISLALSTFQKTPHCILKNTHNYLCLEKFKIFLEKDNLNETEINLAIKLIIWTEETKTGDRDEIALTYNDYPLWHQELSSDDSCSGKEHAHCFWHKQINQCQNSDLVLTYQNLLLEKNLPINRNLTICEARDLEKSLTLFGLQKIKLENFTNILEELKNSSELINQKNEIQSILDNLQLLWGYLHKELTQNFEEFIYPQKIVYSNALKTHPGFLELRKQFKEFFLRIEELLIQLDSFTKYKFKINRLRNFQKDLQGFFEELHENEVRFFHAFPSGDLHLQIDKIELKSLSCEIANKYKQIICLDENLGTINGKNEYTFDYWKKSLGFEDMLWQEKRIQVDPKNKGKIDLSFLLSKPSNQNIFERTCELITETVQKNKGKTLVLFTSYANINTYFGALGVSLQKLGYKVLPQGGGGVKKIKAIFEQNPNKSVIFGIERSFHREFFDAKEIKTIILNKLVFDFPGDPLVKARQEKYGNSFMDFSLPRSILSFKQNYLKLQNSEQVFMPIDTRITEKRYGKYFLDALK